MVKIIIIIIIIIIIAIMIKLTMCKSAHMKIIFIQIVNTEGMFGKITGMKKYKV